MSRDYLCAPVFERTKKLRDWIRNEKPYLCTERAKIFTDSFKANESHEYIIRKAIATADYFKKMTIWIHDGELIVGNFAEKPRGAPVTPESDSTWMEAELDSFTNRSIDAFCVTEGARDLLMNEIFPYWRNKTVEARLDDYLSDSSRKMLKFKHPVANCGTYIHNYPGHVIGDYTIVLNKGFLGIIEEIKSRINNLDMSDPQAAHKLVFYRSALIMAEAAAEYGLRFAKLAAEMAETEKNEIRKKELLKISEVCTQVPAKPARNLWEAIQSFWFVQMLAQLEADGTAVSCQRFDKLLYPYYINDKKAGITTRAQAQELVECFWCKCFEVAKCYDYKSATFYGGYNLGQELTIGGVDIYGRDDTNEMSFIILDAENNIRLTNPNLTVRINKNTPEDFFLRVARHIRVGTGKPALFNDEVAIPAMLTQGVSLEDARDYSTIGCVEPSPIGKAWNWTNSGFFSLAKCLELALNDGKCRLTDEQMGPRTGDPKNFDSFDKVLNAYKTQVEHFVIEMSKLLNAMDLCHQQLLPMPFFSLVMHGCLEKGIDLTQGGTIYNHLSPQGTGIADVADGLAAIKKLVFDEKSHTMAEFIDALDNNYEGFDYLYYDVINNVPKYGNDIDYVDDFATFAAKHYCDAVAALKGPRGPYQPGLYTVTSNVPLGMDIGALPGGKLSGAPIADGLSPAPRMDLNGPTAVARSIVKIDTMSSPNGALVNMKFTPKTLEGEENLKKFVQYLRTYFNMGAYHMQINVVDADTLRDAQEHPDAHKNLLIRVAGYSAFFTELDKKLQDALITRTEHAFY